MYEALISFVSLALCIMANSFAFSSGQSRQGGQEEVSENPPTLIVNKHGSAHVVIRWGSYVCLVFSVQQKCV
jgi:hypothetical protein